MSKTFPLFKEFSAFITERHAVYLRRTTGKPKPWTKDPVILRYRFCNVYRELDTVTTWIRTHWCETHAKDSDLWFAMVVARLINWPESLAEGGYPVPWKVARWRARMTERQERGEKVFTGAYMIHADRFAGGSKTDYLAERVLTPIWEARREGRKVFSPESSLRTAHEWLMKFRDMGSFMSAQVVADVKHTALLPKTSVSDWWTWAAPGPGSVRGLNRLLGKDVKETWKAEEWLTQVQELRELINAVVKKKSMPPLCAQDTQNCLCEFDKHQRVLRGEGRPRSTYPGGEVKGSDTK